MTGAILNFGTQVLGSAMMSRVITAAGPVAIASGDDLVVISKPVPETTTVTLPAIPNMNEAHRIKDGLGNSPAYHITLDGNGHTIDGNATFLIDVSYQSVHVVWNGTEWSIV